MTCIFYNNVPNCPQFPGGAFVLSLLSNGNASEAQFDDEKKSHLRDSSIHRLLSKHFIDCPAILVVQSKVELL